MGQTPPPTGDRIATEVEREMQLRLYRLRNVVLAPSEYHVYLHPDDFRHIELIVPRIVLDIQACLNALVERLNNVPAWSRVLGMPAGPPIEVPAGGWAIHIKPSMNGEVGQGEIGIHSRLSVPMQTTYGSGAGTVKVAQTIVSGTDRRTSFSEEAQQAQAAASAAAPGTGTAQRTAPDGPRLIYTDDSGAHVYGITKDLTKIGRGGEAHWVDLTLVTGTKVSREHCQIRRDDSGAYVIRDVSSWGTQVNGKPIPRFVEGDPSTEHPLGDSASIDLAGSVRIDFRTV